MSEIPFITEKTQDFLDNLKSSSAKPLYEMTPNDARDFLENLQQKSYKEIECYTQDKVITTNIGDINLRIFKPSKTRKKLPVILYIHGGGWVLGSKNSWDRFLRQLSKYTNTAIIFPEYSLSPEVKYPIALNQIYSTLEYIYSNPTEFNINPEKIIIAGDSVGGNMATVTALRSIIENGPELSFELLLYPVTSSAMDTESYKIFSKGPWLTQKAMEWFWNCYEPDQNKRKHPYISPLNTNINELKKMPKTLIITAENDVLRDEGKAYAQKLDEAGVDVMCVQINGTCHDFMVLNALTHTNPVEIGFLLCCSSIKSVLEN